MAFVLFETIVVLHVRHGNRGSCDACGYCKGCGRFFKAVIECDYADRFKPILLYKLHCVDCCKTLHGAIVLCGLDLCE